MTTARVTIGERRGEVAETEARRRAGGPSRSINAGLGEIGRRDLVGPRVGGV